MSTGRHLSSETIDLLLMAALAGDKESEARAHLDGCPVCQKRWAELNEDKLRFEQFVFPRTVGRLEERLNSPSLADRLRAGWKALIPAMGLAAAASVAFAVFVGGRSKGADEAYVGIKGGASFEVVAYRPESGQFPVKAGTVLKARDKIRFVVNGAGAKYVLIASRDGAGGFSVYHPFGAAQSGAIEPGRVELPGSIELDEVVGLERLVAVFSDAPVQADAVKAAMEANPQSPKVADARVVSWEFSKSK
jgi:hypothetical protein